ncbi:MAG TPA: tetratricopeptide repeat protein [Pyrinomonadaceae bacterium]|nr:tetratricopeptide repeat protein [Pyrinomonadaceae bacterium]
MRFSKVTHLACACALLFSSLSPLRASGYDADVRPARASAPPSHVRTEVQVELTEEDETTQEEAAGAGVKKRPNLFVRIISAPFRGLAKLFGGGGKSNKTARVKAPENKKQEAPATNATVAPAANDASVVSANNASVAQVNNASIANNVDVAQVNNAKVAQPNVTTGAQTTAPRTEPARTQSQPARVAESASRSARAGEKTGSAPPVVAATPSAVVTQPRAANKADESFDYEPRRFTPYIEGVAGDPLSQGRALLANGYTNEAISELSIAAVTGPDLVEANNLLGLAYDRRGQHKQAREFYERALSVAPHTARVVNNLGHSLYLDDRYNEALAQLKTAARLAPADTQIANNLALVYGRLGKYDNAFKEFKRAGGEFYARTRTAELLTAAGRDRDAIKHYEAARKLDPASSDVLRQLITLYVRTGQREKAEAAERLLEKTPANTGAATSS